MPGIVRAWGSRYEKPRKLNVYCCPEFPHDARFLLEADKIDYDWFRVP